MHEADNAYSIWSTWLCYRLVQFLTVAYNGKYFIWICRLLIFSIWMCHFDLVVYLGDEPDNQALTSQLHEGFHDLLRCSCLQYFCL